jgi:hypothetical protein
MAMDRPKYCDDIMNMHILLQSLYYEEIFYDNYMITIFSLLGA